MNKGWKQANQSKPNHGFRENLETTQKKQSKHRDKKTHFTCWMIPKKEKKKKDQSLHQP